MQGEETRRLLRADEQHKKRIAQRGASTAKKRPRRVIMPADVIDRRSDARYRAGEVTRSLLSGFRACAECGTPFRPRDSRQRFCSDRCNWRHKARARRERRRRQGLCTECGEPLDPPPESKWSTKDAIQYCEACRERFRAYHEQSEP